MTSLSLSFEFSPKKIFSEELFLKFDRILIIDKNYFLYAYKRFIKYNFTSIHHQNKSLVGYFATFTKSISFSFFIPWDSWICPKIWILGLRFKLIALKAFEPTFFLAYVWSSILKGGPWVTKISTPWGILLQIISSF